MREIYSMDWDRQMDELEAGIRLAWSKVPIPAPEVIFTARKEDVHAVSWNFHFKDLETWMAGRSFDDLDRPGISYFEMEQPMFRLTAQGCSYYLGGYLLLMAKDLKDDLSGFWCGLEGLHLAGYLGDERLSEHSGLMTPEQKAALIKSIDVVLYSASHKESMFDIALTEKIASNRTIIQDRLEMEE